MSHPARPRPLLPLIILLFALGIGGSVQPPSPAAAVAAIAGTAPELLPTDRHRSIARRVFENLDRAHYSQVALDDRLSSEIFDLYIESLDGGRSYFFASDIAEFERLRLRLDDSIKSGALEPSFAIFARFRDRNRERMTYAISLLDKEPDYTPQRELRVRPREGALARERRRDERTVAQAREERRPEPAAHRQEPGRKPPTSCASVTSGSLRRIDQVSTDDVFENFMNAFARAYDPHSSYFSPRNSEEYRIAMSLSYEGIGASLQLVDDYVTVLSILPGGPAAASEQLTANDRIVAVGQGREEPLTDVIGWRLDDVVQLIRGPLGSVVRLQILPAGAAPGSAETHHRIHPQQGHARGASRAQGSAQGAARRPGGDARRHHGAELLPGLQRARRGRQELSQHHARCASADQRAEDAEDRWPDPRPARQRRWLPARGHGPDGTLHQGRTGGAAARDRRRARGAGRSGTRSRLSRPARCAGRPLQRFRIGNLRRAPSRTTDAAS